MISSTTAAILERSTSQLVVDEISLEQELGVGQVLVEIEYSGICGAQINEIDALKGPDKFLPHLLGHEGYGRVIDIGPFVKNVRIEDKVILHWKRGNGIQANPYLYSWENNILNSGWVTTFSQHSVVSENRLTVVPSDFFSIYLPLLGCGLTTAFGSLSKDANMQPGESILILGVGGVGSLLVKAAEFLGAGKIVTLDSVENRSDLALSLGADSFISSGKFDSLQSMIKQSEIEKFDLIVDTTGNAKLLSEAFLLLKNNGRLLLIGVMPASEKLSINTLDLNLGKKIIGSHGGDTNPATDIPNLFRLLEKGRLDLSKIPNKIRPLNEINSAINEIRRGEIGKQFISMKKF